MNPKVISYTFRNSYKHNLLNLMQTNQENFCHKKLSVPKLSLGYQMITILRNFLHLKYGFGHTTVAP